VRTTAVTPLAGGNLPLAPSKPLCILSIPPLPDKLATVVGELGVADAQQRGAPVLVSVVVPVLNGMPWIEHQLQALAAQQIEVDWEVVVADNGSDDETRSCVTRWSERSPRIRLVDASARRGEAAAKNTGVRAARGRFLVFCDADDVVQPGWLASMFAALGDADLVAGIFDFSALDGGPKSVPIPPATRQLGFLPFGLGANLAVRREVFEAVHGFSEDLPTEDDVDLCWRIQLAGYSFAVADAVVEKRERSGVKPMLRAALGYGRCGPRLYERFRADGMRRDLRGAVKAWTWLVVASPGLVISTRRRQWVRTFGIRAGRLAGSVHHRVFFP
jgi:glycosyltransferase involved in cell wall biosynthesis